MIYINNANASSIDVQFECIVKDDVDNKFYRIFSDGVNISSAETTESTEKLWVMTDATTNIVYQLSTINGNVTVKPTQVNNITSAYDMSEMLTKINQILLCACNESPIINNIKFKAVE